MEIESPRPTDAHYRRASAVLAHELLTIATIVARQRAPRRCPSDHVEERAAELALAMVERLALHDSDRGALRRFLFTVAESTAKNLWRHEHAACRRTTDTVSMDTLLDGDAEGTVEFADDGQPTESELVRRIDLVRRLRRMTERQQQVALAYATGTGQEAATQLRVSTSRLYELVAGLRASAANDDAEVPR